MQQLMRFKYWLYILVGLGVSIGAAAQSTTVSGTVIDSGGQVWANGTLSYVFQNNGSYSGPYQWNGGNLPNQYLTPQIVTLNGSGGFSISIPTSTAIAPSQSTWKYVVCPNASFQCSILTVQAIGTTQNISSTITAATPTLVNTIQAGPMPLAYTDAEIITTPNQGGIYFNVTSFLPKYFDGTSWHFYGTGGGSGTPGGAGFSIQYNNGGTFGGASFNGIVVASTSTLPTAATFTTIISLWSSCTSGYLKFDGTCSTPSSGIPTTPNNALIKVNGGSGSVSSLFDTGTAITTGEPIAAANFNGVVLTVGAGSTTFLNGSGNYVTPSISFSQLTGGTLTSQTLICGTSCSIATTSSGTIAATAINGVTFSTIPSAGMVPVAINSGGANWQFLDIGFVTNGASLVSSNIFNVEQIMPKLDFTFGPPLVGLGVAPTGACSNHNFTFGSDGSLTVCVGGVQTPIFPGGTGTVTSIATTGPIGGGTITTTGTITCTTCVVASSPGIGIAHFAGGTQTVTSSLVALGSDVSGNLPNANLAIQTANTVLGALTATTPSGLAVPSCSGASNALTWTTGAGFGCNTISGGGALTPSDGPLIVNLAGNIATPLPFSRMFSFGTSYESGAGVVDFNQSFVALLHKDVAAPLFPHGASGTKVEAISANALDNYFPDATLPNIVIMGGSENDSGQTCSLTTPCEQQYQNTTMATMAWLADPYQYRIMASKATPTGTWTADTNLGTVACSATTNCPYTPIGTPMKSSVSGSTLTFSFTTTTAQTHIRVTSNVQTAQTGTYTVTVDGSLVTDNCSGTTTFTATPCGGSWASGSTAFGMSSQQFTITGATSHTVVITTTNTGVTGIVSVDVDPLVSATNLNTVMFQGQNQFFTNFSAYNVLSAAVVSTLKAANLNTYFVSPVSGTPGFNQASDVSTTATATCAASIAASHLNYCGNVNATQTFENAAKAAGIQFTCYNCGGNIVNSGNFDGRISVYTVAAGTSPTTYDSAVGLASNATGQLGSSIELLKLSNTARYGIGNFTDSSSGFFWSGAFPIGSYGVNQDWCDYLWTPVLVNGTPRWTQSDYKAQRCLQYSTGMSGQLGGMTAAWIGGVVGGTLPTFTANAGAGTTPTITLTKASNISGIITIIPGTTPTGSANIVTITFGATNTQAYQTAPKCFVEPANAASLGLIGTTTQPTVFDTNTTTALFIITGNTVPLVTGTTYVFSYMCTQ